jgi:hypothetical protein
MYYYVKLSIERSLLHFAFTFSGLQSMDLEVTSLGNAWTRRFAFTFLAAINGFTALGNAFHRPPLAFHSTVRAPSHLAQATFNA